MLCKDGIGCIKPLYDLVVIIGVGLFVQILLAVVQGIIPFQVFRLAVRPQLGTREFPVCIKLIQVIADYLYQFLAMLPVSSR